jgi:putative flippase GtrA
MTTFLNYIDTLSIKVISFIVSSEQKRETLHQFVKFALIGVINTAVDFSIYFLLTRYTGFFNVKTHQYTPYGANIISFLIATTFSFYANRSWTFKREDKASLGEAARFYSTTVSGLALNSGLLYILVSLFHFNDLISKVFTTLVTIFWNFLFKKFFVFVPPKVEQEALKVS